MSSGNDSLSSSNALRTAFMAAMALAPGFCCSAIETALAPL